MAAGEIVGLNGIPFIDCSQVGGKFLSSLNFFDGGDWRIWFNLGDGKYIESKAWPAEGFYYSRQPEKETDLYLHFLDFTAQKASYVELIKPMAGLRDDLFNLSASLAKISHIHKTKNDLSSGDSRMVITEVEYIFSVCRSMIDLFQEIAAELWNKIKLYGEALPEQKKLKKSFNEMIWFHGRLTTVDELRTRFGLPPLWAEFYMQHVDFFLHVKNFRDRVIHNGSQVQTIFSGDSGYLVNMDFKPFLGMSVWEEADKQVNDLVPLLPGLGILAYKTIMMCNSFSFMLEKTIQFPTSIVPGMNFYMRGHFDEHFLDVLMDAERRVHGEAEKSETL